MPRDATAPQYCPLKLETGVPDDYRKELSSDFELYGAFWLAWQEQDRWSLREHAMFWGAMLPRWPSREGQPSKREQTALAYRAAEHRDLDPAAVLDRKPDTLRKKEVEKQVVMLRPTLEQAMRDDPDLEAERDGKGAVTLTDYMLPRVFVGDEPEPDKDAFTSIEEGREDEKTKDIRGRLGLAPAAPFLSPKQRKLRAMIVKLARENPDQLNDLIDQGRLPLSALQGDGPP